MKHVHTFESYIKDAIKDAPKTIAAFFNKQEEDGKGKEKTLQEECDEYVNQHCAALEGNVDAVEYTLEYVEFLRYTVMQNNLELLPYFNTHSDVCAPKPYPMSPVTLLGKELLSTESLEADEMHSKGTIMAFLNMVRKPERLLERLSKVSENNPFEYLSASNETFQNIKSLPESHEKHLAVAALSFVLFTYRKLRALFEAEKVDHAGEGIPGEAGASGGHGVGLNRLAAGAGIMASIAALGKLTLPESAFQSQGADTTGCFRTCQRMVGAQAPPHLGIKMAKETSNGLVKLPTFNKGIDAIESHLADGQPIIVGVDDKKGSVNHDNTTDHFVVIVSSGKDDKGAFYRFYDPGTSHRDKGTSEDNRFYMDENGLLSGTSEYNKTTKHYTVSWVRPTA